MPERSETLMQTERHFQRHAGLASVAACLLFAGCGDSKKADAVELCVIPHQVVADELLVRDAADRKYNVWTDSAEKASAMLDEFGLKADKLEITQGQILAVFLNERIQEDLTQIVHNKSANQTFADYADSGREYKLKGLPKDKKYVHATAVVFRPPSKSGHLGMRGMVAGGLSEKYDSQAMASITPGPSFLFLRGYDPNKIEVLVDGKSLGALKHPQHRPYGVGI
jgi:hypothetical protein